MIRRTGFERVQLDRTLYDNIDLQLRLIDIKLTIVVITISSKALSNSKLYPMEKLLFDC